MPEKTGTTSDTTDIRYRVCRASILNPKFFQHHAHGLDIPTAVLFPNPQYISIIIIGGGQAGLSVAYCLRKRGVDDYVIFEQNKIAQSWRSERWDNFCLVTPNCLCSLPGHQYDGDDPEGFMKKDEFGDFLEKYAKKFKPPILENVTVTSVTKQEGFFHITTNQGTWFCDDVIVAVGSLHTPFVPDGAEKIPSHIQQFHALDYKNPSQIPEGETVIVGSGQSGVQIMEDLHLQGRKVHLCLGNTPRSPRRYRGKDAASWLEKMEISQTNFSEHPDHAHALASTDHYLTGRDGGREIDLRKFAIEGVKLYGFVNGIESTKLSIRQDLAAKLEAADQSYNSICRRIDYYIAVNQIDAPKQPHYKPVWAPTTEPTELNFAEQNVTSIIWCMGFLPDFRFIKLPVFNMLGFPEIDRGVTALPGLYFLGLPWQHPWASARYPGIAGDADFIAARIEANLPQSVD